MKKISIAIIFLLVISVYAFAQNATVEKSATVFGAKIRYLEAGDQTKPTVILLHGLGAQAESWQLNIAALSQNYRVIALDQLFGKNF